MPFLIPAVTAFVSDSFIIWLHRLVLHANNNNNFDNSNNATTTTTLFQHGFSLLAWNNNYDSENYKITDQNNDDDATAIYHWVYNVQYVTPCAVLRLILLIVPLFFHSYTGTAIKCAVLYKWFYTISLCIVLVHMISLALLNPTSIEAIFPNVLSSASASLSIFVPSSSTSTILDDSSHNDTILLLPNIKNSINNINNDNGNEIMINTTGFLMRYLLSSSESFYSSILLQKEGQGGYYNNDQQQQGSHHYHRILLEHMHEMRRIWWMLTLSLLAISCHWILLWHVRSTAPHALAWNSRYKKPSVYFAVRTASSYNYNNNNDNGDHGDSNTNEPALIHAMNEFVIDMQSRLQRAKTEWATRLEDFGNRITTTTLSTSSSYHGGNTHNNNTAYASIPGMDPSTPSPQRKNAWPHQHQQRGSHPIFTGSTIQPFRVLLQLFAYEDVLENRRLDALFDLDDGETITFFVPQLLSFLLHGALYSSPLLEEWVLSKCRGNVYFAHRCYWFLRAWCLEAPAEFRTTTTTAVGLAYGRTPSTQSLELMHDDCSGLVPFLVDELAFTKNSDDNAAEDDSIDIDDSACHNVPSPIPSLMKVCPSGAAAVGNIIKNPRTIRRRSSNNQGGDGGTASSNASLSGLGGGGGGSNDKFLPEERAMIERLMMRVKECGEEPARRLEVGHQYTHNHMHNDTSTTSNLSTEPKGIANATIVSRKDTKFGDLGEASDSGAGWEEDFNLENSERSTKQKLAPIDINRITSNTVSTQKQQKLLDPLHTNNVPVFDYDNRYSMTSLMSAAEAGFIPVDPASGIPSVKHFEALTNIPRYGFLPSERLRTGQNQENTTSSPPPPVTFIGATEHFDKTPQFLDALLYLAENLFFIPREDREETLRQQLRSLECELLPSNAIYLPLGGNRVHHSVWRVVVDECIPLSTKERVPCIVALEVIEFATATKRTPVKNLSGTYGDDQYYQNHHKGPQSPHNNRSPDDADYHDTNYFNGWLAPEVESKILEDWIHGHRQPFRRTSLLDKVATTVKVPFDKMKTQVRDHILSNLIATDRRSYHNSNDSTSEEMQPLSLSTESSKRIKQQQDSSSTKQAVPTGLKTGTSVPPDVERGVVKAFSSDGVTVKSDDSMASAPRSLSRIGSDGSIVSLGQWALPSNAQNQSSTDEQISRTKMWSDLKRRLDDSAVLPPKPRRKSTTNGQLPYGSDHEDDQKEFSQAATVAIKRRDSTQLAPKSLQPTLDDAKPKISRPPRIVFRESWAAKQERIRKRSAFGNHPRWKLLPILIKANDDLRQEQLACQLIHKMASILAREKINVWLYPYEIIALTDSGGLIEAIPDTISLDSLKKNGGCTYTSLNGFFISHFGEVGSEELASAKANFVESLAAYSMVCFILQIKDRHNGNILLDNKGHLIHIDFGFFFLSSPGKNVGFESAPFKLTRDFVEVLDGSPDSHLFRTYRSLCVKTFIALRRRCMEIILLVEMLKVGNEGLPCFRGRPDDAIQQLRERFRLDLNDRACTEYVNSLIDDSIENWRTDWYDRYQRYFVGVL